MRCRLGGGKTYHPGLPPNNDGALSWSSGPTDPKYVKHGDKATCTSDYFSGGPTKVCPDNGKDLTEFTDYANLQGMLDSLR